MIELLMCQTFPARFRDPPPDEPIVFSVGRPELYQVWGGVGQYSALRKFVVDIEISDILLFLKT